ncbi:MAG: hypothetical protein ACR2L3_00785 [Actinomycetota bacterium]
MPRTRSWLAVGLFLGSLVVSAVNIPGVLGTSALENEDAWGFRGSGILAAVVFAAAGALLAIKRPENPVGWLFGAVGLAFSLITSGEVYAGIPLARGDDGGIRYQVAWFSSWGWIIFLGLIAVAILLFPSGHLPSPRWRLAAKLMALGFLLGCLSFAFAPGPLNNIPGGITNRYAIPPGSLTDAFINLGTFTFMAAILIAVLGVIQRFRVSRGLLRQQMKLFVFAATALPGSLILVLVADLIAPEAIEAVEILSNLSAPALPIAMSIAILRHRLYDIDVIINRTLVYGALTAILVLAYLGSVVFFQQVLAVFTIDSDLVIAASTLAVAALFRPLRVRVQRFIDRRFYRSRYDAAETLSDFSARLRDEVDLGSLREELIGVVGTTMQPAHASLWVRTPTGGATR